jgi:Predicted sugar phosphatases of the HAD superfamily
MVRVPQELFDAYLFDLDGTIYLGDQLLPGASRMIAALRRLALPVRFISNNPTHDPSQCAAKLTGLGIPAATEEIVNSVVTTVAWLKAHHPDAVVFPIAEAPLQRALAEAGIRISDRAEEVDIVIASYDRGFDYRKLQIAFDAIWFHQRAFLIQTNPDRFCPYPGGRGQPDAAAITAAIEAATGVQCRHSFGKPDPLMLQAALATLPPLPPQRVLMVGDRLHTDVAMATGAGVRSAVVLTGEATAEQVAAMPSGAAPDFVLARIDQLIPAGLWGEFGWAAC